MRPMRSKNGDSQVEDDMERTIIGSFATRRHAEIAVEHLVQEHGIAHTDIFIKASGRANSAGTEIAGADIESGHPGVEKRGKRELAGAVEVAIDCHGDDAAVVEAAFKDAGATQLHSRS
jgi:hypothetical protein